MAFERAKQKYHQMVEAYSGKSVDELFAITNGRQSRFLFAVEIAIQQKQKKDDAEELSEAEIIVLAIQALEREVNNGGYSQFFANSSREFTPVIVYSLKRIGSFKTTEITERAIRAAGLYKLAPSALNEELETYRSVYFRQKKPLLITPEDKAEFEKIVSISVPTDSHFTNEPEWDAIKQELHECDQLYYKSGENVGELLVEFVKSNKNTIQP